MEKKDAGILRKLWSSKAPSFVAARIFLSVAAGTPLFYNAMAMLPGRPLTCGEKNGLRSVFNDTVDYDAIRINSSPIARFYTDMLGNDAMAFGNTIFVGTNLRDGLEKATGDSAYELIHETAHVRSSQHDSLISLRGPWQTAANFLTTRDRLKQYEYRLEPGKKLSAYNLEQQASIVADWFNIRRGDIPLFLRNYDLTDEERNARYRAVLAGLFIDPSAPAPRCTVS